MKRKTLLVTALSLLMAGYVNAQVFLNEDRYSQGLTMQTNEILSEIGEQPGEDHVPVGSGALLLMAMSGAYLFGKKNRKN